MANTGTLNIVEVSKMRLLSTQKSGNKSFNRFRFHSNSIPLKQVSNDHTILSVNQTLKKD